ncbi:uncharacterized protein zgc:193726 isoform X2 [Pimephales promelas]|uniref:uncharacterized protein zgc:193726 isoform X2 n=1 Tax=Pimephales promelas TaxID=90988 RepID=UPI001955ECAD|nr:uncharacterized protein zgc:193726 isoform X2 [Pimephales promelas]
MNSMFSVWTLSSLILTYTLAFPIFNNTSRGSYMETFPNVTEIMEDNITRLMENFANISGLNERRELFVKFEIKPVIDLARGSSSCPFPTCGLHILADSLQTGDENAGNIAQDPWGPGKK